MTILKQSVGIDIAKDEFYVSFMVLTNNLIKKIKGSRKFKNNIKGFTEFHKWLDGKRKGDSGVSLVMESTGVYYEELAYYFHNLNWNVHVLLPLKVKRYLESLPGDSKTDKIDAAGLAQLGLERDLPRWQVEGDNPRSLKRLMRERNALVTDRTRYKNRLHALKHSAKPNDSEMDRVIKMINTLDEMVWSVEKEAKELVKQDATLKDKFDKVCTIPGVSFVTAATIIGETNGFAIVSSIKQLTSYAGLDIRLNESGNFKGKTTISKKGNVHVRRSLYFAALTNLQFSENNRAIYDRINKRTGRFKMSSVAVQRKVLGLIYTLWKNNTVYQENYLNDQI